MRIMLALVLAASVHAGEVIDDTIILRGDANSDSAVNLSDASYIASYYASGGPAPECANQADANHDGSINLADASYITNWYVLGGPAPPYPGPFGTGKGCVSSPYPVIGCDVIDCP